MKKSLIILGAAALAGCATSHTIVTQPNGTSVRAKTVTLVYDDSTVGAPAEAETSIKNYMTERFFAQKHPAFTPGPDLTVRYRFVGYDEGNRMTRWLTSSFGGGGDAHMIVEAEFLDSNGATLSKIQSQGEVGAGIFGGSHRSAIKKAADEVATYAERNFANR